MKIKKILTVLLAAALTGAAGPALYGQTAPAGAASGPTNTVTATSTAVASPPKNPPIEYTGADLSDVIRSLARKAGMNIILGDDVKGTVTTRLVDVPIEQALKTILESKGYVMTYSDGVYQIRSKASIANEPTETRIITLTNATTKGIEAIVKQLIGRGGRVQIDDRSRSIIISDTPSSLKNILPIIQALDTPTPQVMIEFRLLETSKNPILNTGVRWSGLADNTFTLHGTGADGEFESDFFTSSGARIITGPLFIPGAATLTANELSATLNFLISNTDTDLLANPKVVTTDNTAANIRIVRQQPIPNFQFNSSTASFVLSGFDYVDIGTILQVTPHVNRDQFVTLDLRPEFSSSSEDATFDLGTAGGGTVAIPIIARRNVDTHVVIKSGETLALGGLIQNDGSYSYSKVPLLGDIPLIGYAFKSADKQKVKRNLLMFITPTIIPSGGKTGLEDQITQLKGNKMDDFADNHSWLGNAKGYQIIDFGQVVEDEPLEYDFESPQRPRVTGPDEQPIPTTSSAQRDQRRRLKEEALDQAVEDGAEEQAEPVNVSPMISPRLR